MKALFPLELSLIMACTRYNCIKSTSPYLSKGIHDLTSDAFRQCAVVSIHISMSGRVRCIFNHKPFDCVVEHKINKWKNSRSHSLCTALVLLVFWLADTEELIRLHMEALWIKPAPGIMRYARTHVFRLIRFFFSSAHSVQSFKM